ncbi:o-succinylbenzoate synthase [Bacteroidota bacterium]
MLKAEFKKYTLVFRNPAGTSRGILYNKNSWYIVVNELNKRGIGECSIIPMLSIDDKPDYENKLKWLCENINQDIQYLYNELKDYPSIYFGLETAFQDLKSEKANILFPSNFTSGKDHIKINGLIWMGDPDFMKQQIREKVNQNFSCIKLKIGSSKLEDELEILKFIRFDLAENNIEIRLDANGAFKPDKALEKLKRYSEYNIHSIEQPITKGYPTEMAELCERSPIPIVLDEELIGISKYEEKEKILKDIKPQYIILKPSLLGGFNSCEEWIKLCRKNKTGWWITSALESNIGLNSIAQWTYTLNSEMPQGLGTGKIYTNNIISPLELKGENLFYNSSKNWDISDITNE